MDDCPLLNRESVLALRLIDAACASINDLLAPTGYRLVHCLDGSLDVQQYAWDTNPIMGTWITLHSVDSLSMAIEKLAHAYKQ